MKKILLVIDMQRELQEDQNKYQEIIEYICQSSGAFDEVWATALIRGNPLFQERTACRLGDFKELEFPASKIITKTGYGLDSYEEFPKENHYTVIGSKTDGSVTKVLMDLFDRQYSFTYIPQHITGGNWSSGIEAINRHIGKKSE